MKELLAKHPDLREIITLNPNMHLYRITDIVGDLQEVWEKDEDGHWHDVTNREKARIAVEKAKAEVLRLQKLEAYKAKLIPVTQYYIRGMVMDRHDKLYIMLCAEDAGTNVDVFVHQETGTYYVEAKRNKYDEVTHLKLYEV